MKLHRAAGTQATTAAAAPPLRLERLPWCCLLRAPWKAGQGYRSSSPLRSTYFFTSSLILCRFFSSRNCEAQCGKA